MPSMSPSQTIRTRISDEQRAAIEDYCAKHGIDLSTLIRQAVLEKIGRSDLFDDIKIGRPPKAD